MHPNRLKIQGIQCERQTCGKPKKNNRENGTFRANQNYGNSNFVGDFWERNNGLLNKCEGCHVRDGVDEQQSVGPLNLLEKKRSESEKID
jgi:hypothetical protein